MQRNKRIRGRRPGRSGKVLLPALFAILLGAVGAFVTLVAFGQIDVDAPGLARFFGGREADTAATDVATVRISDEESMYTAPQEGMTWVPLVVKPIPAYTMIGREHLTFQHSLRPWPRWLWPEEVSDQWVTEVPAAMGRVAKFDIPLGTVLTESALMPAGTRPGLMGAIPTGTRGLVVSAGDILGSHSLRQWDHVDLFATFEPVSGNMRSLQSIGRGVEPIVTGEMIREAGLQRPELRVIVENAIVVTPVSARMTANRGRDRLVEEMTLAASPDEIAALTEALKLGATLHAVVRPGAAPNEDLVLEASTGAGGPLGIEEIVAGQRTVTVLPGGSH